MSFISELPAYIKEELIYCYAEVKPDDRQVSEGPLQGRQNETVKKPFESDAYAGLKKSCCYFGIKLIY